MIRKLLSAVVLGAITVSGINAEEVLLRYGIELDDGWGAGNIVVSPYVSFPEIDLKPFAGSRITKVRIGVNDEGTNCYLYIKNDPKDATPIYREKLENLRKGWNEITLSEPFEVKGNEPIAIGYKASFSVPGSVGCSKEKFPEATTVYLNSSNNWTTTGGGALAIQAVVEGDNLPADYLRLCPLTTNGNINVPYEEETVSFPLQVRNKGIGDIKSFKLRSVVDGKEEIREYRETISKNGFFKFDVELPAVVPGTHSVSFDIAEVNGAADRYEGAELLETTFKVYDREFRRRVVIEEYSGLWCGICPGAMVMIEEEVKKYPDHFIPICVHGGDELQIELPENAQVDYSWEPFTKECAGAPWCWVDRKHQGNPLNHTSSFNNTETYSTNNVNYSIEAYWDGDEKTTDRLRLVSTLYTSEDIPETAYRIAYAVTEDNLTGYFQTNYYADNANGPMGGWESKASITDDVVFNDIARGIFPDYYGEEVKDITSTVAYERYAHEYSLILPPELIEKVVRENLNIIGLLINAKNGYIVNAMKTRPRVDTGVNEAEAGEAVSLKAEDGAIEVSSINDSEIEVVLYDLTGCVIARKTGAHGFVHLNGNGCVIVRVSVNGKAVKTCKMIIK